MEKVEVETLIVGAGVIGLAIGAELARKGRQPFLVESESSFGSGISSRNSEVIHSGIYYPEASFKRRFCTEGRDLLYAYCDSRNIAYRKCGKFVVATSPAEIPKIEAIGQQAKRNGVDAVALIDGKEARKREPALQAVAALDVRETGIVDSHSLMLALLGEIEDSGGAALFSHKATAGRCLKSGCEVEVDAPSGPLRIEARELILAAGLRTHALAASFAGYDVAMLPALSLAKGSYFSYSGPAVFSRLIYPAPVDGGLGTHLTIDLAGRMRFGPDVEWLDETDPDRLDFSVDPARGAAFYEAIRRYWPALPEGSLISDYSGVRPKLSRKGEAAADFLLHGPADHGIAGLVGLYGIESPGLTASLAIARHVAGLLA